MDKLQNTVNTNGAIVNWIRKGNIHLTLKFIGDVPEDDVDMVSNTIKNIISSSILYNFKYQILDVFQKKRDLEYYGLASMEI
jgi:2'-5' RNA ligase